LAVKANAFFAGLPIAILARAARSGASLGTLKPDLRSIGVGVERDMSQVERDMAKRRRKYSRSAGRDVENEMHRYKRGTARSGRGGKGGKVKSRKQAIAIGLSKARKKGKKVPKKRA
jgi:hypothetical protein